MAAGRKGRDVHALFLLDKPAGLSSNQALQKVRRLFDARKAGHTGTLDPFATGLLPICLGEATKTAGMIMDGRKTYVAELRLGTATATGDIEGDVVASAAVPDLDDQLIENAMRKFRGPLDQVPPMYSAIKQDGRPLYELARQGVVVERKARTVEIYRLELLEWHPPVLTFEVACSKGTYVRTLAEDLARSLGTCGHLQALRRTSADPFVGHSMFTLEELEQALKQNRADELLMPADAGLPEWPVAELEGEQVNRFMHGNVQEFCAAAGRVRVHGLQDDGTRHVLGLAEIRADNRLHPIRVFAPGVVAEAGSSTFS